MGAYKSKDKGNIFCANRRRAPFMALIFDALTFPAMLAQVQRDSNRQGAAEFDLDTLDKEQLARSYINIKPFCSPYPACLLHQ